MKTANQLVKELIKRLEQQRKDEVADYWLKKIKADLGRSELSKLKEMF